MFVQVMNTFLLIFLSKYLIFDYLDQVIHLNFENLEQR